MASRTGALAEGDALGSFRVGAELGEGATGIVYRGFRETDGLAVALKVLKAALSADQTYLARFRREARVATEVQSAHLVPLVEFGEIDGIAFLATEFREGGSLDDLIVRDGRLPVTDCMAVATATASGLAALHEHGIVHRDVKPANVMLDRAGDAALTDFGLARSHAYTVLTRPGQVLGTLDYIAPELIEGNEATPLSDVYALGCLVYECITGATPFSERGILEVAVAHLEEDPPDPRERRDTISEELAWALLSALAKEPEQRPPSAVAYARLLAVAARSQGA